MGPGRFGRGGAVVAFELGWVSRRWGGRGHGRQ
jgi:hypothetical protein